MENIIEFLSKKQDFLSNISSIITIILFIFGILQAIINHLFRVRCEEKYGIPKELFNYNFIERLIALTFSFIFIVIVSTTFLFKSFENAFSTFIFQLFILFLCNMLFITFVGIKSPIFNIYNNIKTSDYFIAPFIISLIEIIILMFTEMKGNEIVKVLIVYGISYILIVSFCVFYGNRLKNNVQVININNVDYCLMSRVHTKCVLLKIDKNEKCYYKRKYIVVEDNGLQFKRVDFDTELKVKFN